MAEGRDMLDFAPPPRERRPEGGALVCGLAAAYDGRRGYCVACPRRSHPVASQLHAAIR